MRRGGSEVGWNESEIRHVLPHSAGGRTTLSNGALVHKSCHLKSEAQTRDFALEFLAAKGQYRRERWFGSRNCLNIDRGDPWRQPGVPASQVADPLLALGISKRVARIMAALLAPNGRAYIR
jgi:hypothetical protein